MLLYLAMAAIAAPEGECPPVAEVVGQGWAAFYDAELELAKDKVAQANALLACQGMPVPTEDLLALYRLDALAAVALGDPKGAVYATIRAVVTAPDAVPPEELGPDLAELHLTWSGRLRESTALVRAEGAEPAWVDGRKVEPGSPLEVLQGEHLVQYTREGAGWLSEVREIAVDLALDTPGQAPDLPVVEIPPPEEPPVELPPDVVDPGPVGPGPHRRGRRTRRAVLLTTSGLLAAGGGATAGLAWTREQTFIEDDYLRARFGQCEQGMPCYDKAREDVIRADASAINQLYVIGYSLAGAGLLLAGTELILLPGPGRVAVGGTW